MAARVDPVLLAGWLAGRSIARGLPPPVLDHGGWRIDTASDTERWRYVFAETCDGLRHLAATLYEPCIPLKLCDTVGAMRALLPARWMVGEPCHLMTGEAARPDRSTLPPGYRSDVQQKGAVRGVRILAPDGTLAASGYAASCDGYRVFDRIVTQEAHRRLGLGRAMMALLADDAADEALPILVATHVGAALYGALGWTIRSPYSTAVIAVG